MTLEGRFSLVAQHPSDPGRVFSAITGLALPSAKKLYISVAYATEAGCRMLFSALKTKLGDQVWRNLAKEILVSLDYGITEPSALKFLIREENTSVFLSENFSSEKSKSNWTFHPKVYAFSDENAINMFVGSANLTQRAMSANVEAGTLIFDVPYSNFAIFWNVLQKNRAQVSEEIIEMYTKTRESFSQNIFSDEFIFEPTKEDLKTEIAHEESLTIGTFKNFWIQTGSMSSGWSRNQLELPRYSFKFFGLEKVQEAKIKLLISNNLLDGKYTWHGSNGMERLYLPTKKFTGIDYSGKAILFQRNGPSFVVEVISLDNPIFTAWKSESLRLGSFYKLSSVRTYGFF